MNKFVKKGIKNLNGIKKDAIVYSKNAYNDYGKPMVKTISKKISKIDFNGIYKGSLKTAKMTAANVSDLAKRSGKLIRVGTSGMVRSGMVRFRKVGKFINKRAPVAGAAVLGFAAANFTKAEKYLNLAYPRVEKFMKANYPTVQTWVVKQLPKVEAFLAGQLSARLQKFAA
jgi:hypothetical protein